MPHEHSHHEPVSIEDAVRSLLLLAQVAIDARDFESAVDAYESVLQLEQNEAVLYNLGTLRARGLGTRRSYVEAARLFHQAELLGNERAGKLCGKCMLDHMLEGIDARKPVDLYAAMAVFVSRVYPEATEQGREVNRGLLAVAGTLLKNGTYDEAVKVLRAAAEYGDDESAQRYLAELDGMGEH